MYSEVAAYELRFYKKELRKRSMIRIVLKKSVKSPINLKIQVHIYIYTCIIIKDLSIYIYIYIYMYIERRRQWHPTSVLLPKNPMDRGAWQAAVPGVTKSRTRLSDFTFTFHFHALEEEKCSCLENPRDGGAWWAAVYGVAQSRTRLKRLSSSSSNVSSYCYYIIPVFNIPSIFPHFLTSSAFI